MKTTFTLLTLAATLAFVGCEDNVYDEQAEIVRDNSQNVAEDIRDNTQERAAAIRNEAEMMDDRYEAARPSIDVDTIEDNAEERADAVESQGETMADAVEELGETKADYLEEVEVPENR